MATAAYLPFPADRYQPCVRTIRVKGYDLTGVALRAEVRLTPNTPGDALFHLDTVVTANTEGLRLLSVEVTEGIPTSVLELRINKTTMATLPYSGEVGDDTVLAYDLIFAWNTINAKRRLYGPFLVLAGVSGADAATLPGGGYGNAQGYGITPWGEATLTFSNDDISLSIDGLDRLEQLIGDVQTYLNAEIAEVNAIATAAAASLAHGYNIYDSDAAALAVKTEGQTFGVLVPGATAADQDVIEIKTNVSGAAVTTGIKFGQLLPGQERTYQSIAGWYEVEIDADGGIVRGKRSDGGTYLNGLDLIQTGGGYYAYALAARDGSVAFALDQDLKAELVLVGEEPATAIKTGDGLRAMQVQAVAPGMLRYTSAQRHGIRQSFRQIEGQTASVLETDQPVRLFLMQGESVQNYHANEPGVGGTVSVFDPTMLNPPVPYSGIMLDGARAPSHPEPQSDSVADPATATDIAKLLGGWDPTNYPGVIGIRDGYNGRGDTPRGQGVGAVMLAMLERLDRDKGRSVPVRGFATGGQGGRTLSDIVKRDLDGTHLHTNYAPFMGDDVQFQPFSIYQRLFHAGSGIAKTFIDRATPFAPDGLTAPVVIDALLGGIGVNDQNPYRTGTLDAVTFATWLMQLVADSQADALALTGQGYAPLWVDLAAGTAGATFFPNYMEATLAYHRLALDNANGGINPAYFIAGSDYHLPRGSTAHKSVQGAILAGERYALALDRLRDGLTPHCLVLDADKVTASLVGGKTEVRIPFAGNWRGSPVIDTTILPATESAAGTTTATPVFGATDGSTYTKVRGGYPYIAAAQNTWLSGSDQARRPDFTKFVKGFWAYQTNTWQTSFVSADWHLPTAYSILAVSVDDAGVTLRLDTTATAGITIEYALNGPGNYGATSNADGFTGLAGAWGNVRDSLARPSMFVPGYLHHNWLMPGKVTL